MNNKQNEILRKEFNVRGDFSITRAEYESFPCAMVACLWSDAQMENLAKEIAKYFNYDTHPSDEEELESVEMEWYKIMESCAINLGMKYYEDLTEEEYADIYAKWDKIK